MIIPDHKALFLGWGGVRWQWGGALKLRLGCTISYRTYCAVHVVSCSAFPSKTDGCSDVISPHIITKDPVDKIIYSQSQNGRPKKMYFDGLGRLYYAFSFGMASFQKLFQFWGVWGDLNESNPSTKSLK